MHSWQAHGSEVDRRLAPASGARRPANGPRPPWTACWATPRAKNGWPLAETTGDATPYGLQHLLGRAVWSADAARDALYAYVTEHLGDPEGVAVVDKTGFPQQGAHSAGVAPQYCGTLGKVGNCQVGGFLAYVGALGHTLLDRELYLPEAWTRDGARLQAVWGWPPTRPWRPSRSWPSACWNGRATRGCRWPG